VARTLVIATVGPESGESPVALSVFEALSRRVGRVAAFRPVARVDGEDPVLETFHRLDRAGRKHAGHHDPATSATSRRARAASAGRTRGPRPTAAPRGRSPLLIAYFRRRQAIGAVADLLAVAAWWFTRPLGGDPAAGGNIGR